jgi:hypothetical protein
MIEHFYWFYGLLAVKPDSGFDPYLAASTRARIAWQISSGRLGRLDPLQADVRRNCSAFCIASSTILSFVRKIGACGSHTLAGVAGWKSMLRRAGGLVRDGFWHGSMGASNKDTCILRWLCRLWDPAIKTNSLVHFF